MINFRRGYVDVKISKFLSSAQLQDYRENGYLVLRNVFSAEEAIVWQKEVGL